MLSLKENLVESKHHKLARSLRSGPSDHDLKPNAATRDQLNVSGRRGARACPVIVTRNGRSVRARATLDYCELPSDQAAEL